MNYKTINSVAMIYTAHTPVKTLCMLNRLCGPYRAPCLTDGGTIQPANFMMERL